LDLVVTVCDPAAEECPVWLGKGKRDHLSFPDPTAATGTAEEQMEAFRSTRDAIVMQVPLLLKATIFSRTAEAS
jgi:arsenate reductase (thioredoxin)